MKVGHLLICVVLVAMAGPVAAQRAIIKGRVTEQATASPLAGAIVTVAGTSNGTSTDLRGEYQFYVNSGETVLRVKYLGYQDTTIRVVISSGELHVMDVALSTRPQALEGRSEERRVGKECRLG